MGSVPRGPPPYPENTMIMTMLDLLNCPNCGYTLKVMDAHTGLLCPHCRLVYPIRDEVPFLVREEAVPLSDWKHGARTLAAPGRSGANRPSW